MKVVVTGGCGTVGRVTVQALIEAGHEVTIVDITVPLEGTLGGAAFVEANAVDYEKLLAACAGADGIVHLAGISKPTGRAAHLVHNINVQSSYNALCVAEELGIGRVVMASSVNTIGLTWSRDPNFDYFPVDESHPTRNEDPYSLSKWLGEMQADSAVRLNPGLSVASIRLHMFMSNHAEAAGWNTGEHAEGARRGLWGYTTHRMWIDACLGALTAPFTGHERFLIVADRNAAGRKSQDLARENFPHVEMRRELEGDAGFFDCSRARELLGWSGGE